MGLIEMKKNLALTLALLCAWASLLQTSVATKKAVLRAVASLMSVQNLWATFVARTGVSRHAGVLLVFGRAHGRGDSSHRTGCEGGQEEVSSRRHAHQIFL